MSEAVYEIFLLNDHGERVRTLEKFISFSLVLVTNGYGPCSVTLDGVQFGFDEFQKDYRLEFERNGTLVGRSQFTLTGKEVNQSAEGEDQIELYGYHANHLFKRRIVAYYANSSPAKSTTNEFCDNLIKRVVRYNMGANAQTGPHAVGVADNLRDKPAPDLAAYFSVEADLSQAATTNKAFSHRDMLPVLQEIAQVSYEKGTPLFFGVELDEATGKLVFKTRTNWWGQNRTGGAVLSPDFNNLVEPRLSVDWENEITVVYALGDNQDESRVVQVETSSRATASVFGWHEATVDMRNDGDPANLTGEAQALLNENQEKIRLRGRVQETDGFLFQEDWDWGDKFDAEWKGQEFDVWINRLAITMEGGEEKIEASIETVKDA